MNDISQIFNFNDSRPMTTHSLHKLTQKSFEKLGWMVLAIKYNDHEKINCYIKSLERLKNALERKSNELQDQDKRRDIQILLEQVNFLNTFVNNNLKKNNNNFSLFSFGKRTRRRN